MLGRRLRGERRGGVWLGGEGRERGGIGSRLRPGSGVSIAVVCTYGGESAVYLERVKSGAVGEGIVET